MIQIKVSINSAQLRRAEASLNAQQLNQKARGAMRESLELLQSEVRDRMFSFADTFQTLDSVQIDVHRGGMSGTVGSSEKAALVMEVGRKPGARRPPFGPILAWVRRKGVAGKFGTTDKRAAFLVLRAIERRGMWQPNGLRIFEQTAHVMRPRVNQIWNRWFK